MGEKKFHVDTLIIIRATNLQTHNLQFTFFESLKKVWWDEYVFSHIVRNNGITCSLYRRKYHMEAIFILTVGESRSNFKNCISPFTWQYNLDFRIKCVPPLLVLFSLDSLFFYPNNFFVAKNCSLFIIQTMIFIFSLHSYT